jgi:hypothetical protein
MHGFTLFLAGPDVLEDAHMDALFEAGCDDAVFGERDGAQYASFDRDAPTFCAALTSAIDQLTAAVPGLRITRVEPDQLVSMAAIAERVGLSREQIRLLSLGARGPGGFPAPVSYVDGRTRLWSWPEVSRWLVESGRAKTDLPRDADLVAALNAALSLRAHAARIRSRDDMTLLTRVLDDLPSRLA